MNGAGFRQTNAWLHTWSGLLLGWLLFAVFFTGTLSYFRQEITFWMQPELHASQPGPDTAARAVEAMQRLAPDAASWQITLPDGRNPTVRARWFAPGEAMTRNSGQSATLDATTLEPLAPRATRGGDFLYRFHFELHGMPRIWGRWIVGIATAFMLVAIVSGVITHKKIFADFFTFRRRKGQRSWMDAHNALAVLALPFHFMITYSGLVLFMFMLMPWGLDAAYEGDRRAFFADRGRNMAAAAPGTGREGDRATAPAPTAQAMVPIAPLLATAAERWPQGVSSLSVEKPNTSAAVYELRQRGANTLLDHAAAERLRYRATDGTLIDIIQAETPSAGAATYNVLSALHRLRFADAWLRWLFFIGGLLGTAMVGTGLVLWVVKRLPQKRKGTYHAGHRLVERLNVAAISGLILATGLYMGLGRVLPAALAHRSTWEIQGFFIAWALTLLHAWLRPHRAAWREQLLAIMVVYAALPLFNVWPSGAHLLATLTDGRWMLAAIDLVLLATAVLSAWAAWYLKPGAQPVVRRAATQAAATAATPSPAQEVTP